MASLALCDILNRLPVAEMAEVAGELFLPIAAQEAWRRETGNAESLRWTSQERIEDGALRVDLLLRSDGGQPLLVVENKIGSGMAIISYRVNDLARSRGDGNIRRKRRSSEMLV